MCTIILGVRVEDNELPWTVAANRDERCDRPSAPPCIIEEGGRRILMPQDLVYGGTWIGMNDRGLLVALTNRDDPGEHCGERSRGLLVRDALRLECAHDVAALAHDTAAQYKHFHLVAADFSGDARLVVHGSGVLRHERLPRGWHVITEQSFGAGEDRRGAYIRSRIAAHPHTTQGYPIGEPTPSIDVSTLVEILGTHWYGGGPFVGSPFDSPCVQTVHNEHLYGTRSLFAATFDPYQHDGLPDCMRWWAHEGPTCTLDPKMMGYGRVFGAAPEYEHPPPLPLLQGFAGQVAPPPPTLGPGQVEEGEKKEEGGVP